MSQSPQVAPRGHAPGNADVLAIVQRFLCALRPPLAEILALSHPLSPTPTGEARSRRDLQVHESAELIGTLQAQVGELLALHRDQPVSIGPVDARSLLQSAADVLGQDATVGGVRLCLAKSPHTVTIAANQQLASRVVLNVVSNAVRYSQDGGTVTLDLSIHGDEAVLTVADNGIGMTPDEVATLFQPFERMGKELSATEGTGMGLVISQRLMQLMNGRITITSHKNQGTIVSLIWPLVLFEEAASEVVTQPTG